MVQRKLFLDVKSNGLKPENRFSNLATSQELKKKKKKMKRTRPTRLKDTVSQPGKPPTALDHRTTTTTTPPQKQSDAKVTDGSPNYMKGTSSSEARRESVPRNVLGKKKLSGSGTEKQSKGLRRESSLKMTKTPSFKRCSRIGRCSDVNMQRATCSSTLKDSKFPEYLMLSPGATESEGTSAFKVCPYTYCSLNGHLHVQYPPLKSFISSRRRALKSQKGTKMEVSSPGEENLPSPAGEDIVSVEIQEKGSDGFVEIYVSKKNESEQENGFCSEGEGQVSESLSDGAPRSEIDSEESFGFYHEVFATRKDPNDSSEAGEGEKEYPSKEMESESISEITNMVWEGVYFKKPGVVSDSAEMVNVLEDDIKSNESDKSDGLVALADDGADGDGTENMFEEKVAIEQSENANDATEKTAEVDEHQDTEDISRSISGDVISPKDPTVESKMAGEIIIQMEMGLEMEDDDLESNDDMPNTPDDSLSSETKGHAEYGKKVTEEKEKANDLGDEQNMCGFGTTEEISEGEERAAEESFPPYDSKNVQGEGPEKMSFACGSKSSDQDQTVDFRKWIIKCKKTVKDIESLRAFNPREPNYLPIALDPDDEKVYLKHQDVDERKNTEEWMIDYALQRAVSKLGPARKKRVALLVQAFETVIPVPKCQTNVKEPSKAFACGRSLQACN
ncbi:PREDICTED: uncharacterized protein LOC104803167 [Tarenaya hassleriana]|uniref:uncharacterized protein LOC104803167 n=1 Tax=Tarenaya hassleriana TaxID=28532 RepID=UPI00053C9226|nr:PREDICTED: uncharacterized protein LOC104803167 [Tarenaya hassleriana]XP_010525352.1 PREDICTED: uncharacterized protein LOC104803167 [Tarenaya hassleriana]